MYQQFNLAEECGIILLGGEMHLFWKERFIKLFIVIGELIFNIKEDTEVVRFIFSKVRIIGQQNFVKGDIQEMKYEFGQNIEVEAKAVGPTGSKYQEGSAEFSVQAADADGTDISSEFTVEANPENELKAKITRTRTEGETETECTGVVTLRADGDPDVDEVEPVVGTLAFIYDAPNVTGFDLVGTVATEEQTPEA